MIVMNGNNCTIHTKNIVLNLDVRVLCVFDSCTFCATKIVCIKSVNCHSAKSIVKTEEACVLCVCERTITEQS